MSEPRELRDEMLTAAVLLAEEVRKRGPWHDPDTGECSFCDAILYDETHDGEGPHAAGCPFALYLGARANFEDEGRPRT